MRDYNFEYTDTKFTLKLIGLSFLAFVVLLIAMVVTVDLLGIAGALILAFGVPVLIFFLNKKKIKKIGTANIYDSSSEFKLADSTEKVVYADIKTYQVERYNGTHLKIKFKDGKDFKLQANSNFCNSDQFDILCGEFEKTVQQFKSTNNVELTRKPSMFERAWMLPFLIILTAGLIGGIVFAISQGKSIPPTFYTSAAIVIPMWIGYFNARKRKQEQQTK
jgi:hypothetical protein